jgi:hypothetical protein
MSSRSSKANSFQIGQNLDADYDSKFFLRHAEITFFHQL